MSITTVTERETQLVHYLSEMTKVANNAIAHIKELEQRAHEIKQEEQDRCLKIAHEQAAKFGNTGEVIFITIKSHVRYGQ